jgi:acetamidase/formamidase
MKSIEIDRSKRLKDQPGTGHNRFHPDIPPLLEVESGEEVVLQTRDAVDGQVGPSDTEAAMANMEAGAVHPLTGPVFVKGAQPGDMLEVEFLSRGGLVFPPDATAAVPDRGPAATEGLRTLPPRENGGNFDVKQLTKGSKLLLPVSVEGACFSTGDAHFAQGDGEVCVTAVEMGATAAVRFQVLKGAAAARRMRGPRFSHPAYFTAPEWAVPQRFVATMGMPIRDDGVNEGENLTLACRNALLNMLDLLQNAAGHASRPTSFRAWRWTCA